MSTQMKSQSKASAFLTLPLIHIDSNKIVPITQNAALYLKVLTLLPMLFACFATILDSTHSTKAAHFQFIDANPLITSSIH